jgi:hypothetical protein
MGVGSVKLWLIKRSGGGDWDECNAIVVRAETLEDATAEALAVDDDPDRPRARYDGFTADNIDITELTPEGEPGLILGTWNWG